MPSSVLASRSKKVTGRASVLAKEATHGLFVTHLLSVLSCRVESKLPDSRHREPHRGSPAATLPQALCRQCGAPAARGTGLAGAHGPGQGGPQTRGQLTRGRCHRPRGQCLPCHRTHACPGCVGEAVGRGARGLVAGRDPGVHAVVPSHCYVSFHIPHSRKTVNFVFSPLESRHGSCHTHVGPKGAEKPHVGGASVAHGSPRPGRSAYRGRAQRGSHSRRLHPPMPSPRSPLNTCVLERAGSSEEAACG